MNGYPSEEELAWLQGLGMKRLYLDSTFKYYPEFGKILLANKQILEKTAKAVSSDPKEREIFFNYFFSPGIQSLIISADALEKVCTALLRLHQKIGVYMQSLLMFLSSRKILTAANLEVIGSIANTLGMNATYVLAKGLPAVEDKLRTMVDVTKACESFLVVAQAAGTHAPEIFGLLLPGVKHLIASLNDIVPVGYALIEAWKQGVRGRDLENFVRGFLATRSASNSGARRAA